jgi:histidine ammonia-lyase
MALTALNILEVKPSEKLFEITNKVKKTIEPMSEDRFFGPDIE